MVMLARHTGWTPQRPTSLLNVLVASHVARIAHLADGFSEPDHADTIARQIQLRNSLGRKPPI
jgi:hypothetical protein